MWKAISHRIIFVAGRVAHRTVRLLSAHAPCEDAITSVKDAFWLELHIVASTLWLSEPSDITLLFTDGNARVGSVAAQCFGTYGVARENDNGLRLRNFLDHFHLCAINTFFDAG